MRQAYTAGERRVDRDGSIVLYGVTNPVWSSKLFLGGFFVTVWLPTFFGDSHFPLWRVVAAPTLFLLLGMAANLVPSRRIVRFEASARHVSVLFGSMLRPAHEVWAAPFADIKTVKLVRPLPGSRLSEPRSLVVEVGGHEYGLLIVGASRQNHDLENELNALLSRAPLLSASPIVNAPSTGRESREPT